MLALIVTACVLTLICFFVAKKLHYDYGRGLRTLSASLFDAIGIAFGIAFAGLMFYNEANFYTIPRIMLFVSACVYVRRKKRKRFCTPFWKMVRNTAYAYSSLGMVGKFLEIKQIMRDCGYGLAIEVISIAGCACTAILLMMLTGAFFECLLNRRRSMSYYY